MARLVPPTAVTQGSEGGKSACCWSDNGSSAGASYPLSPEAKKMPIPSAAPARKIRSKTGSSDVSWSSKPPQESLTMEAR